MQTVFRMDNYGKTQYPVVMDIGRKHAKPNTPLVYQPKTLAIILVSFLHLNINFCLSLCDFVSFCRSFVFKMLLELFQLCVSGPQKYVLHAMISEYF